jgi:hypothetical protein
MTFTNYDGAAISATLISSPMFCRSVAYGTAKCAIANAIAYAHFYSRSDNAVIRVYHNAGNVIETHEHAGDFKELS